MVACQSWGEARGPSRRLKVQASNHTQPPKTCVKVFFKEQVSSFSYGHWSFQARYAHVVRSVLTYVRGQRVGLGGSYGFPSPSLC